MFLTRLKLVIGAVMMTVALGAGGVAYQSSGPAAARAQDPATKPAGELEALRKENELLKLNLQVVLEKVRAQEAELKALKERAAADAGKLRKKELASEQLLYLNRIARAQRNSKLALDQFVRDADPLDQIEAALKKLREARDQQTKSQIVQDIDRLMKKLHERTKTATPPAGKGAAPAKK